MYNQVDFFAEKQSARQGAALLGTVIVASRTHRNGNKRACIAVPRGDFRKLPVKTWSSDEYLARRCVKVTEAEARALHPDMFKALERFDAFAEYRLGHAIEAVKSPLQAVVF